MSCAVEALVERQMRLVGQTTYGWAQRLVEDYQQALTDFQARCEAEKQAQAAFAEEQETAANAAIDLASVTNALPVEDATVQFVLERVQHLRQRVSDLPATESVLGARCEALLQAIQETPEKLDDHFEQYRRLAEVFAAQLEKIGNSTVLYEGLAQELQVLRTELDAPLLMTTESSATRAELLEQLTMLEALGVRQIAVAGQGLTLLRQRVHRELKGAVERQIERVRDAVGMRDMVGDITAKLQAIARRKETVMQAAQAQQMLTRLNDILSGPSSDELSSLRNLSRDVDALFVECARLLEEQDATAYISDQVTDVLRTMGYQVTQLPDSTTVSQQFVAAVDDSIGLQFRVDGNGHLGTKMVALNEQGAGAGKKEQEKVCSIVDEVFTALKRRQCRLRERFRSSLAPGERLDIIKLPEQQQQLHVSEAPIQQRIEEP